MDFGRDICSALPGTQEKEWLVTNGIGGFGMGTISGMVTRRYHGLLVAALRPPLGRKLLVTKLDETVHYDGINYPLFSNLWGDGTNEPRGYRLLERFHLEGSTPVWSFALADVLMEKRIWMEHGANTTYIQYRLQRASGPVSVSAQAFVNHRDYHNTTYPGQMDFDVSAAADGLCVNSSRGEETFYLLSSKANWFPQNEWYHNYCLAVETYRGQGDFLDANLNAGKFHFQLGPGQSVTLAASTEESPLLDGPAAYKSKRIAKLSC